MLGGGVNVGPTGPSVGVGSPRTLQGTVATRRATEKPPAIPLEACSVDCENWHRQGKG